VGEAAILAETLGLGIGFPLNQASPLWQPGLGDPFFHLQCRSQRVSCTCYSSCLALGAEPSSQSLSISLCPNSTHFNRTERGRDSGGLSPDPHVSALGLL
jgi:hypothetical protein